MQAKPHRMKRFVVERERLMIVRSRHIVSAYGERDAIAKTETDRTDDGNAEAIKTLSTTARLARRSDK